MLELCRVATEEGEANAAWAGQWDGDKIMISMGNHQTTVNLNANPDFTIAFATTETMVAADFVGVVSGKKVKDKVAKTGWKVEKGEHVNAPVFTDFPMTMECRIERKIDESETGYYIVAKIVNIRVNEEYLAEDGKPDLEKMHLLTFTEENYSNGEKVGNLIEFTKKGVIWDSWEGRLNLTQTGMNTSGEPFSFSFDNDRNDQDSLIKLMQKAQVEGWNQSKDVKYAMIVYSKNDVPVPCSGLKEHGNGDIEIKRVWVQLPFRGHHLATFMIHELEYFSHEHGYKRTVLMTRERMDYAIKLYEGLGYKRIENYPPYQHMDDAVCYF